LYSADDYAWWEKELGTSVPLRLNAGIFGENLTLSTFGDTPLHIGDRFQIGAVILEVTAPRIPCSTLAARMGDPNFVKKFKQARRPGVYTRVIQTGAIQVGDSVVYTPATEDYLSSLAFFDLWYNRKRDVALIKKGLASPVAERSRERLLAWLS
jgi:MOSC domain-containing protein YiiM